MWGLGPVLRKQIFFFETTEGACAIQSMCFPERMQLTKTMDSGIEKNYHASHQYRMTDQSPPPPHTHRTSLLQSLALC
jgi:hypothetical protein